ncbi:MAG: cyclic nucleotide-binding domain-containing protein [Desulfobacterales bacterium]|nr:cyclic nucleotide-binding domain-containing protein [Desulfobacterales bacterium]
MSKWFEFTKMLPSKDLEVIMSLGSRQSVSSDTPIIRENCETDSLHFILKGLFRVSDKFNGTKPLTLLGPGDIIGATSFFTNKTKTKTSVTAAANSSIFTIPYNKLNEQIKNDANMGVRIYKVLARMAANRLKNTGAGQMQPETVLQNDDWNQFLSETDLFKELIAESDKRAIKNSNTVTKDDECEITSRFQDIYLQFNSLINGEKKIPETVKHEIGRVMKKEFLPFMLLADTGERFYSKPRGYAGDYYTIEMIYQNTPRGRSRLGPVLDSCFLNLSAAQAVRNRRSLLSDEIMKTVAEKDDDTARIMSIACGPAREITDVFEILDDKTRLKATLLDLDSQALSFVKKKISDMNLNSHIEFLNKNIIYLMLGKENTEIEKQDLIYSIGLIDYFEDETVIKLLNYIYDTLLPGGRVILGNFHPSNPSKAFMDYVLEWPLIHRDEDDMNRLFNASKFQSPCTDILFEKERINLFAKCIKKH